MTPAGRPDRCQGTTRLWWCTQHARRSGDVGLLVRAVAGGASSTYGLRVGPGHVLLLLDPALVRRLLVEHVAVCTKGPGVRLTRQLLGDGLVTEGVSHRPGQGP